MSIGNIIRIVHLYTNDRLLHSLCPRTLTAWLIIAVHLPGQLGFTCGTPPHHRPENIGNLPRPATAYLPQNPFLNSFDRQRPSSSHSNHSNHSLPSPIKNRPSMSPTQGNKDVGPLAFPSPVALTGPLHHRTRRKSMSSPRRNTRLLP
jgi:hypothetical protein